MATALKVQSNSRGNKIVDNFNIDNIELENIVVNENNDFEIKDIELLAENIRENGLYHNIMVKKIKTNQYKIISGERRYRAVKSLGWKSIPAKVLGDISDIDETLMLISSNTQVRQLEPHELVKRVEEVEKLMELQKKEGKKIEGRTRDAAADYLGISGRQYSRLKQLTQIDDDLQQLVSDGLIATSSVTQFSALDTMQQKAIAETIRSLDSKVTKKQADEIKKQYEQEKQKSEKELERVKGENKTLKEHNEKLVNEKQSLESDIDKAHQSVKELENKLSEKEKSMESTKKALDDEKKKSNPNKNKMKELQGEIEQLELDTKNMRSDMSQKTQNYNSLRKEKQELEQELKKRDKDAIENPKKVVQDNIRLSTKLSDLEKVVGDISSLIAGLNKLNDGKVNEANKKTIDTILESVGSKLYYNK